MAPRPALQRVRDAVVALREKWATERLWHLEWLPHQEAFLRNPDRVTLLRTGNQIGKSEAGLSEVLFHALGRHPFREPTLSPGEYWIIGSSSKQSIQLQGKLWELVPKDRLKPGTHWTKALGFGGRDPHVEVLHESGGWSIIRFKTTGQEDLDLESATIDGALFDEPPKRQSTYAVVQQRVSALGGWIRITLTPIGADVEWLRRLVQTGAVSEVHTRLTPEACIPVGRSRALRTRDKRGRAVEWSAEWVARKVAEIPAQYRDIRAHGAWSVKPPDAYFGEVWLPDEMIVDELPDVPAWAQLGIDYGHRPGKQYVPLLLIDDTDDDDELGPVVYVVDEYSDETGVADQWFDALGILLMLRTRGYRWSDLLFAGGDRDHMPGTRMHKSNRDLAVRLVSLMHGEAPATLPHELVDQVGDPTHGFDLEPGIRTVKTGKGRAWGSLEMGYRWIYRAMAARRFFVHRRCARMIEALSRFRLRSVDDEWKDVLDGLRYGLENRIYAAPSQGDAPEWRTR